MQGNGKSEHNRKAAIEARTGSAINSFLVYVSLIFSLHFLKVEDNANTVRNCRRNKFARSKKRFLCQITDQGMDRIEKCSYQVLLSFFRITVSSGANYWHHRSKRILPPVQGSSTRLVVTMTLNPF